MVQTPKAKPKVRLRFELWLHTNTNTYASSPPSLCTQLTHTHHSDSALISENVVGTF